MALKMKLIKHGDSADVLLDGRLDAQSAPEVEQRLLEIAERLDRIIAEPCRAYKDALQAVLLPSESETSLPSVKIYPSPASQI